MGAAAHLLGTRDLRDECGDLVSVRVACANLSSPWVPPNGAAGLDATRGADACSFGCDYDSRRLWTGVRL